MGVDILVIAVGVRAVLLMQWEPWERWAGLICIALAIADIIYQHS